MTTSTLLQITNKVLDKIGDKQVSSITNNGIARKTADCVNEAYSKILHMYDWNWLRITKTADSWSSSVATINNIRKINNVLFGNDAEGFSFLRFVSESEIYQLPFKTGDPEVASIMNENMVRVIPYPVDAAAQAKIVFSVVAAPILVTNEISPFTLLPERYLPALINEAAAMATASILDDTAKAQTYLNVSREYLKLMQSNETAINQGSMNVYKTTRRRGR